MRAFLLMVLLLLSPIAAGEPPVETFERTCTGNAPESSGCTTGTHMPILPTFMVGAEADFTGLVTSQLSTPSWSHELTCLYESGWEAMCIESEGGGLPGAFARVGAVHTCYTRDLDGNGTGEGHWSCGIHDVA